MAVERLLAGLTSVEVTASSRSIREPAGRPAAAMDGELGTGWVAARDDDSPTLTIVATACREHRPAPAAARRVPRRLGTARGAGFARRRTPAGPDVDDEGFLRWPKQTVSRVSLRFGQTQPLHSTDSTSGFIEELPVGVSEVLVPGVDPRGSLRLTSPTGAACGFGPELRVGDREYSTSVSGTVEEVLRGMPLDWRLCADDDVTLGAGEVSLDAEQSAEFEPTALTVARSGCRPVRHPLHRRRKQIGIRVTRTSWPAADVPASSAPALLVVPQNYNVGWVARDTDGSAMTPVRVNGWQQGWVVPAGAARTVGRHSVPIARTARSWPAARWCVAAALPRTLWPSRREGDGVLPARARTGGRGMRWRWSFSPGCPGRWAPCAGGTARWWRTSCAPSRARQQRPSWRWWWPECSWLRRRRGRQGGRPWTTHSFSGSSWWPWRCASSHRSGRAGRRAVVARLAAPSPPHDRTFHAVVAEGCDATVRRIVGTSSRRKPPVKIVYPRNCSMTPRTIRW